MSILTLPAAPKVPAESVYSPLTYIALVRCLYAVLSSIYTLIWFIDDSRQFDAFNTQLLLFTIGEIFVFTLLTCMGLLKKRFISLITYVGMFHDAGLAAILVLLTNVTTSPFDFLFLVIPLYGGLLLQKRGGMIAAGISIIAILALYVLLPAIPGVFETSLGPYLTTSGLTPDDVQMRQPATLSVAAISVGILTGQLASMYARVKEKLVVTARDFEHLHGIYAKVLEALPVGVMIVHPTSCELLFSNDYAKTCLGSELDRFAARLHELRPPENTWDHALDAPHRILQLSYFPITLENALQLDGYHVTDVTTLRNAQKKAQQKQRLEYLGEFSAKVAHEIRNPLACISGCAEMMEADAQNDDQRQILDMMTTEIDRLNNLLKDILVFARTPKLNEEPLRIKSFLESQKAIFLQKQTASSATISIAGPDDLTITADKNVLAQIMMTLWQNALEAIPNNCEIRVTFDAQHIEVTDNGPGIAEDVEPHIFEPFYTTKSSGTGLGLATARQLAREVNAALVYRRATNAFHLYVPETSVNETSG